MKVKGPKVDAKSGSGAKNVVEEGGEGAASWRKHLDLSSYRRQKPTKAAIPEARKLEPPIIKTEIPQPDPATGKRVVNKADGSQIEVDAEGYKVNAEGQRVDAEGNHVKRMESPDGDYDLEFVEPEFKGKVPEPDADGKMFVEIEGGKRIQVDAQGYRLDAGGQRVNADGVPLDSSGYGKVAKGETLNKPLEKTPAQKKAERLEVAKKVGKGALASVVLGGITFFATKDHINEKKQAECKENCKNGDELAEPDACGKFIDTDLGEDGEIKEKEIEVEEGAEIFNLDSCCNNLCEDKYPVLKDQIMEKITNTAASIADFLGIPFEEVGEFLTKVVFYGGIVFFCIVLLYALRFMFKNNKAAFPYHHPPYYQPPYYPPY